MNTQKNKYFNAFFACFLLILLVLAGCAENEIEHNENRGIYSSKLKYTDLNEDELIKKGYEEQKKGNWEKSYEIFDEYTVRYPGSTLGAFEAHRQKIRCLSELGEYTDANEQVLDFINMYNELLNSSKNIEFWEDLRQFWFEKIALPLFYKNGEKQIIADDTDDAIDVLQTILDEEPKGPYSAKSLLLMGDGMYFDGDYWNARTKYIMVVKYYQNFSVEREEALFKAAVATAASIEGKKYDPDYISSKGSDIIERGALNFCDDYLKEYPKGKYTEQILELKQKLFAVLAYRQFYAGRTYDLLNFNEAAQIQYMITIKIFGDEQKYPLCQVWVKKAIEQLRDYGIENYTDNKYWKEFIDADK
ncbi:MAG: outer membrane protein assembly factor BamD [Planctomycetes bacterium]|nr:outer membrane protein assembly factor BamD [Planctomycetota bacterium]